MATPRTCPGTADAITLLGGNGGEFLTGQDPP
jgi:hypothetical protein